VKSLVLSRLVRWSLAAFFACAGVSFAMDVNAQESKPAPAPKPAAVDPAPKGATGKDAPAAASATTDPKAPQPNQAEATIKEAAGSILQLTAEVKQIDQKLASIEKSVAEISKSLAPVGALTRPEGTTALLNQAGDLAFDRARTLVFLTIGILAVLVVILLVLLQWALTRRPGDAVPAPRSP